MSDHSIGFGEETIVDIRESKPELTMPQSIMVYWKVEYERVRLSFDLFVNLIQIG